MSREFSFKPAVCPEYEKLLKACSSALHIWNDRRAEVCESRLSGQKMGDELLRFQANYAKAYTVLQNHAHHCPQCQMVSRIAEVMSRVERSDSENDSHSLSDATLYM